MPYQKIATVAVLLGAATTAQAAWVNFVNQTATRLPTGPGQNDPAVTTTDPEEKDYYWADIDRDGDTDLIVVRKVPFTFAGGKRKVLLMNENGVLMDRTSTLATDAAGVPASEGVSQGFLDLTNDRKNQLVDVNNDGWLDMVTCTTISDGLPRYIGHPRVYINKGQVGGVWQGFRYDYNRIPQLLSKSGVAANPRFCSVVAGDVTGDGYVDLYYVDYDTGEVGPAESPANDMDNKLLINQGAANPGVFVDETLLRMGALFNYGGSTGSKNLAWSTFGAECAIADMNGDGIKDVVKITTLTSPIHVAVLTNPAANVGTWTASNYKIVYNGSPYFITPGDLNNDGKLDMVITDDGTDRYLINTGNDGNGAPNFTSLAVTSALGTEGEFGSASTIADLNNDGWNDVIIADVDLDTFGCSRRMHIYHNLGNAPNVTLKEESPSVIPTSSLTGTYIGAVFDIDNDGWKDLVLGRCTSTQVWMNSGLPGLAFTYPNGHPTELTPDTPTTFQVQLTGLQGAIPSINSGKINLSINGGAFVAVSMTDLGGNLYEATIPAQPCGTSVRYFLSGQISAGGSFNDPPKAGVYFGAGAHNGLKAAVDETFEAGAAGWTVSNDGSLTSGGFELASPNITWNEGNQASPDADHSDSGTTAWVTQNGNANDPPSATDVDGGATRLTSPVIDLTGSNAVISVAKWFYTSTPGDTLRTEVSNDDGANWVAVNNYTGQPQPLPGSTVTTPNAWVVQSFVVSDYVTPTSTVRVRFTINDVAPAGIVEGGIDDFHVDQFSCDGGAPCAPDITGNGSVDVDDLLAVINTWGACPGCPSDITGNGVVDVDDLLGVINGWGSCP